MSKSVKILKTLWGVPYTPTTIKSLPSAFNGFEVAIAFADFDVRSFVAECKDRDLSIVTQLHTTGYPINKYSVDEHFESFKQLCDTAVEDWKPDLINVHSGVDSWSLDESVSFYQKCEEFEKGLPVKVAHETHRMRAFYSPF
jgi:hypothetical protein